MAPKLLRVLAGLAPMRWWRALRETAAGARVHPQALLLGPRARLHLGRGSKLGPRVKLDAGHAGRIEIGGRVWIAADVELQTDTSVVIGEGTTVQRRCTINGSTRIGVGCILAPSVFISSGTHPFRAIPHLPIREQERRLAPDAPELDRPVWIQDDCWLGTHAVVCPGVTVGKGSVVGANAVVTRDVPPYSVVAGIPARRIGARLEWLPPVRLTPGRAEHAPYLLDGRVGRDADGNGCVVITVAAPMLAALRALPGLSGVAIDYRSAARQVLCVGGAAVALAAGRGRVELALAQLRVVDGVAYCDLSLPATSDALVEILGLESLHTP
jgi:acetyltransferase-like isoleucine patch superfamily enzyme